MDLELPPEAALEELVVSLREVCDAGSVTYVRSNEALLEIRQVAGSERDAAEVVHRLGGEIRLVMSSGTPFRQSEAPDTVTLVVPVQTRLAGTGAIVVEGAKDTPSAPGMMDLVGATAVQVGLVLDRDQALRDRAQLLVAKDRDRIARDLHDLVIQRLFATGMQLQGGLELDTSELRVRVAGAIGDLDLAIKELRAAIFELGAGPARPLLEEVRSLLGEYAAVLGFQPLLRITGPVERALTPEAGTQMLTALREALSNIARHALATSVVVELTASSAWFRLRVIDDGVGFEPAGVPPGHGTDNLATRATELGGHLALTSAPGQGATLEWVIPSVG